MEIPEEQFDKLVEEYRAEVYDKANFIDPDDEHCWVSLTVGWALGKGLEFVEANDFAIQVVYHVEFE